MNLHDAQRMVEEFHRHIGAPVAERPRLLPGDPESATRLATRLVELSVAVAGESIVNEDVLLGRVSYALEEMSEWLFAHARGDLVAAADAWADLLYVIIGDAVGAGLPGESLFREVHASNMTKTPAAKSVHGKGVKGESYRAPEIRRVLGLEAGK